MTDLKRQLAAIESDIEFIFEYLTDAEVSKLPLTERIERHRKQTTKKRVRPHSAAPRGVKLDEFDVLEIRNSHYWFKDYDPIREAVENNKPKLRRKAKLDVYVGRVAEHYGVHRTTILDVMRGRTWAHVGGFWNPKRGGRIWGNAEPVLKKWNDMVERGITSPLNPVSFIE